MHFIRGLTVIICSVVFLLTLRMSVMAQIAPSPSSLARPVVDEPEFTWLVTVTIETGNELLTALHSRWSNAIISFPVGPGGLSFPVVLPSDATDITATTSPGGDAVISGTRVYFTLTQDARDSFWAYTTAQQVLRVGNQFRIDQRTSATDAFYRQISTIVYPAPYQYVGSLTNTPQIVTTDTLHWDLVVPLNDPPYRHLFQASSWLADPRLGEPDLSFTDTAMSIESGLNPPIAHLTATLRNNSLDITSTLAFLEFYDRPSPSLPPGGPLDHEGGWCGTGNAPVCPALPTFSNPIPSLEPGASDTVVMTYPLTRPGLRDYYFQIDTFGGARGLNFESNETNNVYTLTRGVAIDYLESVVISGPITGTAYTLYGFDAQVSPTLAINRPLTYTWQPAPISGQGTAHASYTWFNGTSQVITVTARNDNQTAVIATHTISIEVPLIAAAISGPITVSQNIPHVYSVSAQPSTATLPINYTWDPEPAQGQATAMATYIIVDPGEHTLNVFVSSPIGSPVSATHHVIGVPPLTTVNIDGPDAGRLKVPYVFTATVEPAEAAPPLVYRWSPEPTDGQSTARATYRWTAPATYDISVTVSNDSGSIVGLQTITLESEHVYLPLLRKS